MESVVATLKLAEKELASSTDAASRVHANLTKLSEIQKQTELLETRKQNILSMNDQLQQEASIHNKFHANYMQVAFEKFKSVNKAEGDINEIWKTYTEEFRAQQKKQREERSAAHKSKDTKPASANEHPRAIETVQEVAT